MSELLQLPLHSDADVVQARQRVSVAARLLGLGRQDQTRLATAVSEVARVVCAAGGGSVRLSLLQDPAADRVLAVELRHARPGTVPSADDAFEVVGRLVDQLDRSAHAVTLRKHLPGAQPLETAGLDDVRSSLREGGPADPLVVLRQQNEELAHALALLREREGELVRLNDELAETNRGVVALYAELEDSADQVRLAQRKVFEELEDALRPPPPDVVGATLAVRYLPAQSNSPTGGDLYDWLLLGDGALHIAVVDVAGHGVESTRTALDVTHALRTLSREGHPLDELVGLADHLLAGQDAMATVLLGRFHPESGRIELAGGGHPPAVLLAAGEPARYVEAPGRPVGYPMAGSDGTASFGLEDGDTLVLYTDGVIEMERNILAGMDKLLVAADYCRDLPLEQLLDAVLALMRNGAELRDDTLVLALRRSAPSVATATSEPVGTPAAPRTTTLRLAGVPESARVARNHVAALCADWKLPGRVREAAQLVASELVANASVHVGGTVELRVLRWLDGVRVEVKDASARAAFAADPGEHAESGRGLFLVQVLAAAWGTSVGEEGKTVWAQMN